METDFEIIYVPLPKEREAEWRAAIHILAELIYAEWLEEQKLLKVNFERKLSDEQIYERTT